MKKLLVFCAVFVGMNIFYSCVQHTKGTIVMEKTVFGKLPDGREVHQYAMTNKTGTTVKVIFTIVDCNLILRPFERKLSFAYPVAIATDNRSKIGTTIHITL